MNDIIKKTATTKGKAVAIFGGVHGNELIGVEAVRWAAANITPERGTIYFVEANPAAIEQNVRFVDKNMNRCFVPQNAGSTSEDTRARELMMLLDECDALLDIHSSNSKEATPFIICEEDGLDLARALDFPIVSTGWDAHEPGASDGYMFRQGKPGFCLECGSVYDISAQTVRAQNSIRQFLTYFGIISNSDVLPYSEHQKHIRIHMVALKKTDVLTFTRDYADFEHLNEGEVFAKDGNEEYRAEKGDCIIFPRPNTAIGNEAFVLGKEITEP